MHSLTFVSGFMPIQPFLELAAIFGVLTLGAFWLEQHGYRLNKFFQAVTAFAIVYWYLKFRLYPPLPSKTFATCLTVASLGIWGWVSSTETYWKDFCRPLIATMDGNTVHTRVIRIMVVILLPILAALWVYSALLPFDPSANRPLELRMYHPAPPAEITLYSPEDFRH
jgi:hypothetical protein